MRLNKIEKHGLQCVQNLSFKISLLKQFHVKALVQRGVQCTVLNTVFDKSYSLLEDPRGYGNSRMRESVATSGLTSKSECTASAVSQLCGCQNHRYQGYTVHTYLEGSPIEISGTGLPISRHTCDCDERNLTFSVIAQGSCEFGGYDFVRAACHDIMTPHSIMVSIREFSPILGSLPGNLDWACKWGALGKMHRCPQATGIF